MKKIKWILLSLAVVAAVGFVEGCGKKDATDSTVTIPTISP